MSCGSLNRKIWKAWKNGASLKDLVREVSTATNWSGYLSLTHIVRYLHSEKRVKFTVVELRDAFEVVQGDVDQKDRKDAFRYILRMGGLHGD